MRNVRYGRAVGALAALVLLAAPLAMASAAFADDPSAQALPAVTNGQMLREQWGDDVTTLITLGADINLRFDGNGQDICDTFGDPLRTSSNSNEIVVDGLGKYGITQSCPNQRVLRDDAHGETVTLRGLTHFTGGEGDGDGGGLRSNGPVNVENSDVSGNRAFASDPCNASTNDVQAQDCGDNGDGGGIFAGPAHVVPVDVLAGYDITVTDSTVSNNEAAADGGGTFTTGALSVVRSTFQGNTAHGENHAGGRGGGAYATGNTTTEDSTFSENTATCRFEGSPFCDAQASGGGFFTFGTADVTTTSFVRNVAGDGCAACGALGGGFYADDGATVRGSTFSGNAATCTVIESEGCGADGGGIASNQVDVSGSTFTNNVAQCSFTGYGSDRHCDGVGGAIATFRLGIEVNSVVDGNVTLDQSTLSGNAATYDGGGIWTDAHTVDIVASTLDHNQVAGEAGGALSVWPWFNNEFDGSTMAITNSTVTANSQVFGGAIDFEAEHGNLVYDTITDNQVVDPPPETCSTPGAAVACAASPAATADGHSRLAGTGGHATGGSGDVNAAAGVQPASVYVDRDSTLESFGTAVAGGVDGDNCSIFGELDSLGYNFEDTDTCDFSEPTDRPNGGDPVLGALGDNGGPTWTQLPLDGSPLINAIPTPDCDPDVTVDQRGVSRPQGRGCEIGSVEVEPFSPPVPSTPPSLIPTPHPTPIPEVVPTPVPATPPAAAPAAAQAVAVAPKFTG